MTTQDPTNNSRTVRVIVDAMGGDSAPSSVVRGAVRGAVKHGVDLILVGRKSEISPLLEAENTAGLHVEIVDAPTVVTMEDPPACVQKEKADSSISVACKLLKDGGGDALISAGNTGALFTAATLFVRRLHGIRRAALGAVIPLEAPFIMVDSGANTDVNPDILLQFARMGAVYAETMLGVEQPRVKLLNNGTEPKKGTPLYQETYALLSSAMPEQFEGNIEGRDLPFGACDVVVCDGFTGNIALKTLEGMGAFMSKQIKQLFYRNTLTKMAGLMTKRATDEMKHHLDHKEYGGAPFLGIAKPVIKSHGSADERSIASAILQAKNYVLNDVNEKIAQKLTPVQPEA